MPSSCHVEWTAGGYAGGTLTRRFDRGFISYIVNICFLGFTVRLKKKIIITLKKLIRFLIYFIASAQHIFRELLKRKISLYPHCSIRVCAVITFFQVEEQRGNLRFFAISPLLNFRCTFKKKKKKYVLYSFSNKNVPGGGRVPVETRARPSRSRRQLQPPCTRSDSYSRDI